MTGSSDAVPAQPQTDTQDETKNEAGNGDSLFARKGAAAPAPVKGGRPAIYLVGDEPPSPDPEQDDAPDTGPSESEAKKPPREAALFDLDAEAKEAAVDESETDSDPDMAAKSAQAPAASLDSEPFDPSRYKPLVLDDAPVQTTGDEEPESVDETETDDEAQTELDESVAPVAAVGRARLLTATLVGAAAAAAVAAVVTALNWYDFSNRQPATDTPAQSVAATAPEAVPAPAAPQTPPGETSVNETPVNETNAAETAAVPPTGNEAPAPAPEPAVSQPPAPVIDLVRIETDGSTLIAGRAAPGTALIILDNDAAIGTVVAGETGDWMLIPDTPLADGEHEIALAVKAGDGAISVGVAPEIESSHATATPTPRPQTGPSYVVQVASVKTAEGAQQEWAKLQAALPDLLGSLEPTIDTAELRDRGTFHRIRLGPFYDRDQARALCSALTGAGKDCLVVRR